MVGIPGRILAGITEWNYSRISGQIPAGMFGGMPVENPVNISATISIAIYKAILGVVHEEMLVRINGELLKEFLKENLKEFSKQSLKKFLKEGGFSKKHP